ncbi:MAG: DUF2141 domain-containing protein [Flavobacteriales bacterium]|nr:DUF2141 domain-containing protein [Flavobacteriales bacterium]
MKTLLISSLLFLFLESKTQQLTIEIKNIPSSKGNLFIGLYQPKDEFPIFGKQYIGKIVPVSGKTMTYTFKDLPQGEYALAIYHDENKNSKLDKNLLGVPTEYYGFSNNARRTFSAPSFEEASFDLKKDVKQTIVLK